MKWILYFLLFFIPIFSEDKFLLLDLKESLNLAKKNNPFYLAEQNNIGIAKGDLTSSKLYPNPLFNNQIIVLQKPSSGNFITPPVGGTGGALNAANRQDWFQITQKIPVAGQREYAIQFAKKNLELSGNNLLNYERNMLFEVSLKWLDVWLSLERLNIIQRTKNYADELLITNQIRLKNQVITNAEFLRTKNIVEQYEANYSLATQAFINEERNLQFLLGIETPIEINKEDNFFNKEIIDLEKLIKESLEFRADLIASKTNFEAATANVRLQEANVYPQPEFGFIYNPQNLSPYYGTFLTIPIPINNRNQGEIQKSQSQLKQALNYNQALESKIKTEVKNSYGEYKTAKLNLEKFKKISENAEKVIETVKYSYLRGGTTIIDFLDAQRSWFEAQNLFYDSIYFYRKSYLQLLYSTGKIQKLD